MSINPEQFKTPEDCYEGITEVPPQRYNVLKRLSNEELRLCRLDLILHIADLQKEKLEIDREYESRNLK